MRLPRFDFGLSAKSLVCATAAPPNIASRKVDATTKAPVRVGECPSTMPTSAPVAGRPTSSRQIQGHVPSVPADPRSVSKACDPDRDRFDQGPTLGQELWARARHDFERGAFGQTFRAGRALRRVVDEFQKNPQMAREHYEPQAQRSLVSVMTAGVMFAGGLRVPTIPVGHFASVDGGQRAPTELVVPRADALPSGSIASTADPTNRLIPTEAQAAGVGLQAQQAPRRVAVVLIDASFNGDFPGDDIPLETEHMGRVLQQANAEAIPIFEVVWPGAFETAEVMGSHRNAANWVRLEKDAMSGFHNSGLANELAARGITDVILMGQYQLYCVDATAGDATVLGYRVFTAPDVIQGGGEEFTGFRSAPDATIVGSYAELPLFRDTGTGGAS